MARLNELSAATESLETLKRRIYRQNRDLAKSNNARALRIKELENDCASMLSENLELRARILKLERQLEDNEARRIAHHALAIKAKLEAQLEEWGGIIAELGLESRGKRSSPGARVSPKRRRISLVAIRPSPSQRRLRDVARDVEELGHITENKSGPRRSMKYGPQQILALRSEADLSVDSIELGPPPVSQFIDEDPVKVDSPRRAAAQSTREPSPEIPGLDTVEGSPATLPSLGSCRDDTVPASPARSDQHPPSSIEHPEAADHIPEPCPDQPAKPGLKRKLGGREEDENGRSKRASHDNSIAREVSDKSSFRRKASAKSFREESASRLEVNQMEDSLSATRRPLANKSTNDDVGSSNAKKHIKTTLKPSAIDEAITKRIASRSRLANKTKAKTDAAIEPEPPVVSMSDEERPTAAPEILDLAAPITEPVLLAPNTPEQATTRDAARGDTPPPLDISLSGETLRPSRRNRAAISYAEPNLRDKMRRPTKALLDAVAGEGKYSRRTSQTESSLAGPASTRQDSETSLAANLAEADDAPLLPPQLESIPASPGNYHELAIEELPASVVTERRKRPSTNAVSSSVKADTYGMAGDAEEMKDASISTDHGEGKDADVYEFTGSSPPMAKDKIRQTKRGNRRQTTSSRRSSTTAQDGTERSSNRRKSMMV